MTEYEPQEFTVTIPIGRMTSIDWSMVEKVQWTRNGKIIATGTLGERVPYDPVSIATFDAPEPEDTDDVEPEPLKEGDWVQVWARVRRFHESHARVDLPGDENVNGALDAPVVIDAIIRPDAGQVPPWVKPNVERCTSLKARTDSEGETVFLRCHLFGDHVDHGSKFLGGRYDWTTAEEHGRITEGGAS